MNLSDGDIAWLNKYLPNLLYDPQLQQISGELGFCAAFDKQTGKLEVGGTPYNRDLPTFICDAFEIRIDLLCLDRNGWPKVYETGGRYLGISDTMRIPVIDLHFYSDGSCCLGLNYAPPGKLNLEAYVYNLLIPFLYRLAYTDKFGLIAARSDLWGEYSHGDAGHLEHRFDVGIIAYARPGRNQPCPCGSGQKYKRCHLDEVESAKRLGLLR